LDDDRMDMQMGLLLRWGVMAATAVMAVGGVVYLARHGGEIPAYSHFRGEPAELRTVAGIAGLVKAGRARGIIQLGCLLMIATPVFRVVFAAYAFARQRDWMYAAISCVVLGLLIWANR
jgi:uncharacterized membrane protein